MGRLFDALVVGVVALGLAAVVRSRRQLWVDAVEELDVYPDFTEASYLVALYQDDGTVLELRSPYPFFGTEWGQHCPIEDEDEDL